MPQLAKSLAAEARRSKVSVHICSPGGTLLIYLQRGMSCKAEPCMTSVPDSQPRIQLTASLQASVERSSRS